VKDLKSSPEEKIYVKKVRHFSILGTNKYEVGGFSSGEEHKESRAKSA
jgi:hypothetical protein